MRYEAGSSTNTPPLIYHQNHRDRTTRTTKTTGAGGEPDHKNHRIHTLGGSSNPGSYMGFRADALGFKFQGLGDLGFSASKAWGVWG